MISTKVPYDFLFGRIDNSLQNYHRLDIEKINGKVNVQTKLKLTCGIYCIFKTDSPVIQLRYSVIFSSGLYIHPIKSRVEPMIMGMTQDRKWWLLNDIWEFPEEMTPKLKEQKKLVFSVDNDRNYVQFQLCFPTMATIQEISIETELPVEFIRPPKCEFVLLGSSVAQDNYCSNHMNICPYFYRTYGIHCSTLGISESHSLIYDEVVDRIKAACMKSVIMDVHHLWEKRYKERHEQLGNMYVCALYTNKFNHIRNLIEKPEKNMLFISLTGDFLWDKVHLNDCGTCEYSRILYNYLNGDFGGEQ